MINFTDEQQSELDKINALLENKPAPAGQVEEIADKLYMVQPGDNTLENIADKLYGNRELAAAIFEANVGLMITPDMLIVGNPIRLPF